MSRFSGERSEGPRLFIPALAGFYERAIPFSWPVLRIGAGAILAVHGYGKIGRTAGPAQLLDKLPEAAVVGAEITFVLMIIEFIGGICISLGLATRFFAAAAAIEMGVLTFFIYWGNGFGWLSRGYEFVLLWGFMFFAIALRGGGPWSVDRLIGKEL